MNNFHVGQKVVCIDDEWTCMFHEGEVKAVKGRIYTIRDIALRSGYVGFRFDELRNPSIYYGGTEECVYDASRFRPVVERKTDISVFQAMLTGKKVEVGA